MKEMSTDRLTEEELATVYKAGILIISYTYDSITNGTVSRLFLNENGGHFILRCNYLSENSIEIVSIQRSKSVRVNKGVVEDVRG